MAYVPVQRDEGRILYQSTMDRAKLMGDTLTNLGETLYKRDEENKAFRAKNSALKQLIAANKEQFGLDETTAKQFLSGDPNKSEKENYLNLATFLEGNVMAANLRKQEEELKTSQAQRALTYAQAQGALTKANAPAGAAGERMTQQQFLSLPAGLDATATPVGDGSGDVIVKSMSNRAPEKQDVTPVNIGGETLLINKAGQTLRAIPNTSAIPAGYQVVPSASAQQAPVAGGSAMAVPEALSQFMPARSMAPADLALGAKAAGMAMQPAAGPSRTAIDSINAVQAAQGAAPAIVRAFAGVPAAIASGPAAGLQPMAISPILGGPADIEAKGKLKAEAKARDTLQGNIDITMNTIKSIERKASRTSVGAPGVTNLPRAAGKFFNMADSADVEALLKTLEGNIAFDALRNLKDSGTSLGQIAIKELELLKSSKGSLEQSLSYPLFMENLNRFKIQTEYAGKKLKVLNSALEKGLNEPTKDFYELDKQQSEALKALEKTPEQRLKDMGFTIKRRS